MGYLRHQPGCGVDQRGNPITSLKYLLLAIRVGAAQVMSGFVLLGNLSWANWLTLHIALRSKLNTSFA